MATTSAPPVLERKKARDEAEFDDEAVSAAEAKTQLSMRRAVRTRCEAVLLGGVADTESAMVVKDVDDYMSSYDESALQWADTDEKKLGALEEAVHFARDFVRKASAFGQDFLEDVRRAKKKDWSGESMARWKAKLKERKGSEIFPQARDRLKDYLRANLREMAKNWDVLDSDIADVSALQTALGATARDVPALAIIASPSFATAKFPAKRKAVTDALNGLRKLRRERAERDELQGKAAAFLDDAVAAGLLDGPKAARAMRTIFAPGNALSSISRYVNVTLPGYGRTWKAEVMERDAQELRAEGLAVRVLPHAAFLALPFAAREAYLRQTDARLHTAETERDKASAMREYLRKSVDAQDWDEARALLKTAKASFPGVPAWADFETMIAGAPPAEEPGERDPEDVLHRMRERVGSLPAGVKALYAGALEEDAAMPDAEAHHFRAVTALMENAAILQEKKVIRAQPTPPAQDTAPSPGADPAPVSLAGSIAKPEPEAVLPPAVPAPVEQETTPGETDAARTEEPTPEEASAADAVPAKPAPAPALSHTEPTTAAETDRETNVTTDIPDATVTYMAADETSQRAVLEEVKQGKADAAFIREKALVPAVTEEARQELNGSVNRQLAADARYLRDKGLPFTLAA